MERGTYYVIIIKYASSNSEYFGRVRGRLSDNKINFSRLNLIHAIGCFQIYFIRALINDRPLFIVAQTG
jgi:hypothetical protein